MEKSIKAFAAFFVITAFTFIPRSANAQTIEHTVWKSFFEAPINDTATLSVGSDTLTISNSHGLALVVASIHIIKDTIEINDVSGPVKCSPDDKGIYRFTLVNDKLVLNIISDDCDGRANAISGREWVMVTK